MKHIILSLFLCFLAFTCFSQDGQSWHIKHDKKQLFSAKEESEVNNSIALSIADFKKKGFYTISYVEGITAAQNRKWIRTIAIYDEKDNELYKKPSTSVRIPDTDMKKMLVNNKTIKIYTWALPKDPAEAARIRIRRVHLCTIVLR